MRRSEDDGRDSEEQARLERAERERLRAQRRLAAKAAGDVPAKGRGKQQAKGKDERPARLKPIRLRGASSSGRGKRPKPASSPRARAVRAAAGLGTALREGAKAARRRSRGVPSRLGRKFLTALGAVYAVFFDALSFLLNILIAIGLFVAGPVRAVLGWLARLLRLASTAMTPIRVLSLVVAGAAVLLALSQFADYRSVSIGTDAYAEVDTVAPAPERDRAETGSAHSYSMVPLATISLLLLVAAVGGRRWRLCLVIAGAGGIAVAVSLLIDRPTGLDTGELELAFEGVTTNLLGGFYAQLFSGLVLAASSLMLGRELRLASTTEPAPSEPRLSRHRLLKRPPKPEGAST